ncbi:MAG: hypothetical protein HY040_16245 [Planctomycetes bacterium]|nr:hypothetical protein [Planctomycetota bacterium]
MLPTLPVFVLSLLLGAPPQAGEQTPESKKAVELFKTATQIAAAIEDQIWLGYDAGNYTFLDSDRDTGRTAIGFSPNPKTGTKEMFFTLGGDFFLKNTPEENVLNIFHEAFHAFQQDRTRPGARWRRENSFVLFDYATLPPRNHALFAIEGKLLHAALKAPNGDDVKNKVRQFLAVRNLRQGELAAAIVSFEKGAESNEGLAEYAGVRAVLAGMDAAKQNRAPVAAFSYLDGPRYLQGKYAKLPTVTRIGRNDRLKFYYTGSAQALLLDRLLPSWKEKVQHKSAVLQDLLVEALGDAAPTKEDAEAALRDHNFEKVLQEEKAEADRKKADAEKLLTATLAEKGTRITIDVSSLGQIGAYKSFDPMNVTVLDPNRRLHTRMVQVAQKAHYQADFTQPVLEDRNKKEYVFVLKAGAKPTAELDGAPLALDKPARKQIEKRLVIATPSFRLAVEAGAIEIGEGGVVVRVKKGS